MGVDGIDKADIFDEYFDDDKPKLTNYQKIKAMSIDEMAEDILIIKLPYKETILDLIIDKDDYEKFKHLTLSVVKTGSKKRNDGYYCRTGTHQYLHRLIMNAPKNMVVDHINHNTLDNRKTNLRVCSRLINSRNRVLSKNNKSGFTAISESKGKYIVQVGKSRKHLGTFNNLAEAITVRNNYFKKEKYLINESEEE